MKISNALHALVAIEKRKDFNRRLNCSIVNVLFFKRSGKEFHAAGQAQKKARLPYVDSRHLEHRGHRKSQSAVDGVLRCCRYVGTDRYDGAMSCRHL